MKKGFTLVEVLVSIAVFTISMATILSCYLLSVKSTAKMKEYTYFENICLNIDEFYDDNRISDYGMNPTTDKQYIYYDSSFNKVSTIDKYTLTYYLENEDLIISIYNNNSNYYVIEYLNYGRSGS